MNFRTRANRSLCSTIALVTLTSIPVACSHTEPLQRSVRYQNAVIHLQRGSDSTDAASYGQATRALSYFEQIDDRAGQWRANVRLANWHLAKLESDTAIPYAREAYRLAERLGESPMLFVSSLQLGSVTNDDKLMAGAYAHAQSPLQKALALTYIKKFDRAEAYLAELDGDRNPGDVGFLYYQVGKHKGELADVLTAQRYYRLADNVLGVIDSLFLAAQLADGESAADFAARAVRAARSAGYQTRAAAIQQWIDESRE